MSGATPDGTKTFTTNLRDGYVSTATEKNTLNGVDGGLLEDFALGVRAKLTMDNHTLSDLHVHWTGDVDGDDRWDFLQNGHSQTRDSRKVDLGNKAKYELRVHRNNDGQPGDQIGGTFYIKVNGGLADLATLVRSGNNLGYVLASDVANLIIIGVFG